MRLEDLVPSLELCKQIPAGAFEDSVFAWSFSCDKRNKEPFVDRREDIEFCRRGMVNAPPVYPAPTLAEILSDANKSFGFDNRGNWVDCIKFGSAILSLSQYLFSSDAVGMRHEEAALRTWLQAKGVKIND